MIIGPQLSGDALKFQGDSDLFSFQTGLLSKELGQVFGFLHFAGRACPRFLLERVPVRHGDPVLMPAGITFEDSDPLVTWIAARAGLKLSDIPHAMVPVS